MLKVSVTGHEGVKQGEENWPNTVLAVNVLPAVCVNTTMPFGFTTVKPTSSVQEPRVPTCTVTVSSGHNEMYSVAAEPFVNVDPTDPAT